MNPYLKRLRERYESLRSSIESIQTTAAEADRDLTETELRSVTEMGEQAKGLYTQIESLTEIETRNSQVQALNATIADATSDQDTQTRSGQVATTNPRDPGHYTRNSEHSFFGDLHRAGVYRDESAHRRLTEHTRALDTTNEGPGVVPPRWLTEEFAEITRQGRALAAAVRQFPLGGDPRPLTLPRQTAGVTGTSVAEQTDENDPLANTDEWDSTTTTVSPKATAGKQIVSRQMLDMSNPAIDQLIYSDLVGEYNRQVEVKVGAAVLGAGPAALSATEAEFADMSVDDTNGSDLVITAGIAVRKNRHLPANVLAVSVDRYGEFLKLKDSTGRPLIPLDTAGPMNVIGVGSVNVDGRIHGFGVIATEGMDDTPDTFAVLRTQDVILFESDLLRFRFEEKSGPESVELGIWGYTAVHIKYSAAAVQTVEVSLS